MLKTFTRRQAQAMGYLPHELISKRRAQFNRLLWRAAKLLKVHLQFKYVPERPERVTPRMLRIRHAAYTFRPPLLKTQPFPWLPLRDDLTQKDTERVEALLHTKMQGPGLSEQVTEEAATQALAETPLALEQIKAANTHRLMEIALAHQPPSRE